MLDGCSSMQLQIEPKVQVIIKHTAELDIPKGNSDDFILYNFLIVFKSDVLE